MHVKIFGAVIVGQLLADADIAFREYEYPFLEDIYLAIGSAGMIDESRRIGRDVAVYHGTVTGPKEVLAHVFGDLPLRGGPPGIFNDACAFRYRRLRIHAPAGLRTPHANGKTPRRKRPFIFRHIVIENLLQASTPHMLAEDATLASTHLLDSSVADF